MVSFSLSQENKICYEEQSMGLGFGKILKNLEFKHIFNMDDNKEQISYNSEQTFNFENDEFLSKNFLDFIEEPIGETVNYFSVLVSKHDNIVEPLIFWLSTKEGKWYRFFMDAWLIHWNEYTGIEKNEIIEDDFEGYDGYYVRNLFEEFNLDGKKIKEIEVRRFFDNQQFTSQVKISIEDNILIIVKDYGDVKPSELVIDII